MPSNIAAVKPKPPGFCDYLTTDPPPPPRSIEVLSMERGTTPGTLAVCSVRVGGIVIRQVRVTDRGRGVFVNLPARKVAGEWLDLVEIKSRPLRAAVEDVVLAALAGLGAHQ